MNKQEEKALAAKSKLIAAAKECFKIHNVEDVGIREICARAGVTTGTFYHYYQSKNDIISAIYDTHEIYFSEVFSELAKTPPYCDKIIQFFAETLAPMTEADGISFTMHRMFNMKIRSNSSHELYKGMVKLLDLAQENREIQEQYDTKEINNYLFMLFRGVVYDWCITPEAERPSLRDRMQEAMECGIRSFR